MPGEAHPARIFSSANLGEVLPEVATPLTASFVKELIEIPFLGNFRKLGLDFGESTVVALINGRFYYDMTALASIMSLLPGNQGDTLGDLMGGYQQKLVGRLLARQKAGDHRKLRIDWPRFLLAYPPLLYRMLTSSTGKVDRAIKRLNTMTAALSRDDPDSYSGDQVLELLQNITRLMFDHIPEGAAAASGGLPGFLSLKRVCTRWLEDRDGSLAGRLLIATGEIEPADSALALSRLASLARSNTSIEGLLRKEESFARVSLHLHELPGGKEFLKIWNDFMARHGHHSRGEFELSKPRWSEAPDYVLSLVKGYMDGRDIMKEYHDHARERELLVNECRAKLKNPLKKVIFNILVDRASRGLSLRERYKSETIRQIAAMRRLYCALGRDFMRRCLIEADNDIFFLTTGEIQDLHGEKNPAAAREVISERRREYEENCRLHSFPVILDDGGEKRYIPYEADGTLEFLTGLPVCPGRARGPARVILSGTADIQVQPGEILVIPYADPGWSPYFAVSTGIVMDMGGMLSHGSIIAREYGIPTVVNVGPATEIIRTGQIVEVDGNCGTVRIIPYHVGAG